jgi:hypothetical protein
MRVSSALAILAAAVTTAKYIVPGARWYDTDGNIINAHAGCVTIEEKTGKFWLFGEYKIEGHTEGAGVAVSYITKRVLKLGANITKGL